MKPDSPIEHIVVLMLENRAFDHMLGYLPKVNGLKGDEYNLADPTDPYSARYMVDDCAPYAISHGEGPGHSIEATNLQLSANSDGPNSQSDETMSGFVESYIGELKYDKVSDPDAAEIRVVMQSYAPESVPTIRALAENFHLCDNWYADVPGPTMPNRLYVHAATSDGYAHNDWQHIFDIRTIYNSVQDAGHSWAVYYFDSNEVANFSQVDKSCFKKFEESFASDAQNDTLPNYSFIVPRFFHTDTEHVNSQHAPYDIRYGELLMADVYEALRGSAKVWPKSLFILTYDEHGGFYDHVPPPFGVPNPDGKVSPQPGDASWAPRFDFTRLGLRVPTLFISPWMGKGVIDSSPYQHTSILATVKQHFGLKDFLTRRDAGAPSFEKLLSGAKHMRHDTPEKLPRPDVSDATDAQTLSKQPLDSLQQDYFKGVVHLSSKLPDHDAQRAAKVKTQGEAADYIHERMRKIVHAK